MGYWHFIRPEGTINYVRNPSFEENITDGWANYSSGAAGGARNISDFQRFGAHSMTVQKNAGAAADRWGKSTTLTITSVNGQDYIASGWVRGSVGATATILFAKVAGVGAYQEVSASHTFTATEWTFVESSALTANATGDALILYVFITGAPVISGQFDAIQLELGSTITTYCDGDQLGCEWLGAEHNSNSQRSAQSRAGGWVVDFDDLNFDVSGMIGAGMSPITLNVDSYAILPGGELNSQKTEVRPFSLTGWVRGTSLEDLHAKRQTLIDEFKPNAKVGLQPVVLRYTGAAVDKEINAYYQGGLEGRIRGDFPCLEQNVALRFLATDPDFYEIGESADILDSNDTDANRRNVSARLRSTGQWDTLGPPNAAGVYNQCYAIAVGQDRTVYFGGNFTNFDNIAAADYIVQYTPSTATWAAVGAFAFNGTVRGLIVGPNGDVYAGGQFTEALGNRDHIAYYDVSAGAWVAMGNPLGGGAVINYILRMAFDSNGDLYVVGNFTTIAGVANASYIARWDGAAWNAVGNPLAGAAVVTEIFDVAIDSQDNVYVGGNFTTFGGVAGADYIAMWDGANWTQVVQLNGTVDSLEMAPDDTLYLGGAFTNAGGEANADRIASWNGQAVSALSTGANGIVAMLSLAPDGLLYAAGIFTTIGGLVAPSVAAWNGASWAHLDLTWAGGAQLRSVLPDPYPDPVVIQNYDLWVGFAASGTNNYAGLITAANDGTEEAYPRIKVRRTGGTSATLYSVRNETAGKVLWFAYDLLDGEELTIDLSPTQKSITSSFWGARPDAILPNSDFGTWSLLPGDNDVSCFVDVAGGPTIEVEIIWPDAYWSAD